MFHQSHRSRSLSFDSPRKRSSLAGKLAKLLLVFFTLMLIAGATLWGMSSAENRPAEQHTLSFVARHACEFRFEGTGLTLIENHCGKDSAVYLMTPQGLHTAPLIDPAVAQLLDKHGCDAPNRCGFSLEVGGESLSGQFNYTLNGQEGFYSFEWPQDEKPRLVESSATHSNKS